VLSGTSGYNLSVNSDMSVSCNCQADGGEGRLGNLRECDLAGILSGPVANRFRQALANATLPIRTCAQCSELGTVPRLEAAATGRIIGKPSGLMVENTAACNLNCVACERSTVLGGRERLRMTSGDIAIVSRNIAAAGIRTLYFFKYGEPFLSPTVCDDLKLIRAENPALEIVISTNGMSLDTDAKREAALLADTVYFSVPGDAAATVERYQRGSDFGKTIGNMRDLIALRDRGGLTRPRVEWKYVLFCWNDRPRQIGHAIELAREAGADAISFWPTTVPYYGLSWRYRLGMLNCIGEPSWKGREVRLKTS
jgi:pyruvate-formate lyase-activating enzyme